MLLLHSIFVVAFMLFFFLLYFTYSIRILHSLQSWHHQHNAYRSVVRMTQAFDLEKCSTSKTLLQVCKQENDLIYAMGF